MNHLFRVFSVSVLLLVIAVAMTSGQQARNAPTPPALSSEPRNGPISLAMDQVTNPGPYNSTLIAFLFDSQGADLTLESGAKVAPLDITEISGWAYASIAIDTTLEIPHSAKWNMLSVPVVAADMHKDTLYPDAISNAFAYEAGYVTHDILEIGRAYWMKFDSAGSNALFGTPIHADTFDVVSGWNMVGSITDPVDVSSVSTIPPGMTLSNFFGYENGYVSTSTIEPGKGYWVKTSTNGGLILDGTAFSAKTAERTPLKGLNTLEIEDASGRKQTLYFGAMSDRHAGVTAEMPPSPPGGVFDARFADGNFVEFYSGSGDEEYPVRVTGERYPLTLRWEIDGGETRTVRLNGASEITGKGTLVSREEAPITINVEGSGLTKRFALSQNYPNPFNPVTRIRYDLPRDVQVKLVLYDLLGREVRVLADGPEKAGVKTVELDGSDLPTGVYFYRIHAGDFVATRKLLLMK